MAGIVSYGVQLNHMNRCLEPTVKIYRKAVRYLVDVVLLHYDEIYTMKPLEVQNYIEKLIHSTKAHAAVYPAFDRNFYKMPTYLRRDALATSIAKVDSYKKLVATWQESGCEGKKPRLNFNQSVMPCFYRGNMFKEADGKFYIKAYVRNDWIWLPITFRKTDVTYIKTHCADLHECPPVLEKRHKKYILRFAYKGAGLNAPKFSKDDAVTKAIGVDLGLNHDAVCSAVMRNGTVTGCRFINHPVEKDRMNTLINIIKKAQRHGSIRPPRLWRYVGNYNREIAVKTASKIVKFAKEQSAEVIVFENLESLKPTGSKRQRIALWRKRDIQKRTEALAARCGIRTAYVCAKNTSRLAYDGSGYVKRDKDNFSLCTFKNGKRYNCDLSASKNIAARYFIRAIKKSMSETVWLLAQANVPELGTRTQCTLATLINLSAVTMLCSIRTEVRPYAKSDSLHRLKRQCERLQALA